MLLENAESISGAGRGILLVDSSDDSRSVTRGFLSSFGYPVDCARSAEEALVLFEKSDHDLVVTGDALPGINCAELWP
jgi:CheY-like chemotaxis protein